MSNDDGTRNLARAHGSAANSLEASDELRAFVESVGSPTDNLHPYWVAPRKSQQNRYERVLLATISLARGGGYEAVQMRDVADRSGVALGTVYTYFQSRDNLAHRGAIIWAALMLSRAEDAAVNSTAALGTTEHILERFRVQASLWLDETNMLDLWVRSTMTDDPAVVSAQRHISWPYWIRTDEASQTIPDLADIIRLIGEVFYAGAVRWAFGQADLPQVIDDSIDLGRRLLTNVGSPASAS
ncbi:TetR/AcrR family transcriptional regulator [Nocardioides marmoriginsengisoli]|uniref:TetR/AcrR family transcriptional regulator n=1 Tax=Nocardioides marmoriginsengisoli TaxID=661483 RepID=UPI00161C68F9|nr:TetR/AcrR family transcriptional regulator [Nocardioides marmoriginsengisoli]